MTTISYWTDDVSGMRDSYRDLLGIAAYYQRSGAEHPLRPAPCGRPPARIEVVSRADAPDRWDAGAGGAILSWHVDGLEAVV